MSDATLPPPRSSSAAPACDIGHGPDSSVVEGSSETGMDSSYISTTKEETSGDSEGRAENKQKRKRTSPKDQAILEAEYKGNPKPNKAARADIVDKVDLNEKEVQIWFQNRRQINRRKSRPLLPHEIAAYGLGGMPALSSDPAPMLSFGSTQTSAEFELSTQPRPDDSLGDDESSSDIEILLPELRALGEEHQSQNFMPLPADSLNHSTPALKRQGSSTNSVPEITPNSIAENVIKSFSSTPGYLANRWNNANNSFSTPLSQVPLSKTPPISSANPPSSCPDRIDETVFTPSTSIRMSLSLDGKAELVTGSPSPPRRHAHRPTSPSNFVPLKRMRTLQRSQSDYTFARSKTTQAVPFVPFVPFVSRLPSGRSMDARTWESVCEAEPRDALTVQAENESHGSAIAAISLLRSTSNSALKQNNTKRNAPITNAKAQNGKRQKLERASSSVARLQTATENGKQIQDPIIHNKDGLSRSPSGDSDKENWSPNEGGGNSRRRPLPSSRSGKESTTERPILGENHTVLSHASFGNNKTRKRKLAGDVPKVFEDGEEGEGAGEEVEQFMRGEISPSKKGDLDCVQGLLSLSQGNWR